MHPLCQLPDQKNHKEENAKDRQGQFRYLSEEMMQKSRQMSEEQNMWKRQIERAEFQAYGTHPPDQTALDMKTNMKSTPVYKCTDQVRVHFCRDNCLYCDYYEEAAYRVYGTPRTHGKAC